MFGYPRRNSITACSRYTSGVSDSAATLLRSNMAASGSETHKDNFTACRIKRSIGQLVQKSASGSPVTAGATHHLQPLSILMHTVLFSVVDHARQVMRLPCFVAGCFPCFAFQSCERMKPAAFDCCDIVPQPSYAVFRLFYSILTQSNGPIVSQSKRHRKP